MNFALFVFADSRLSQFVAREYRNDLGRVLATNLLGSSSVLIIGICAFFSPSITVNSAIFGFGC